MLGPELPFVLDGFLSSYKASRFAGLIAFEDWWPVMSDQTKKLLARPGWQCVVAYDSDATPGIADLLGFAFGCPKRSVLGYVYVKNHYRRAGIGRMLVRALGINVLEPFTYVARTPVVTQLLARAPGARFDPIEARGNHGS